MGYIKEELEGIRKNQTILSERLQKNKLTFLGKQMAIEAMNILSEAESILEEGTDVIKIDKLIDALPILYVHISEIE